jgi:7,8-dihydropterin-6-yl-methyl-4-(beta-D-ribofuranosyl)aminobenzene 5'-phosphate synthase
MMPSIHQAACPLITVLCDNNTIHDDLEASWGFACLIALDGRNILFDTGGDGVVLSRNMARLGIDPASIDLLMISHQHWDHVGGIYSILGAGANPQICVGSSFYRHFRDDMKRYKARFIDIEGAGEILQGLLTTGEMEGPMPEQAAILRTQAGAIVITGCAHPGIVRVVEKAKKCVPGDDIALVMGGFHLLDAGDDEILDVIDAFRTLGVRFAAPSHCSGEKARRLFAQNSPSRFIGLGAGSVIRTETLKR